MTAVTSAPTSSPRTGLVNMVNIPVNHGTSLSGFIAEDIVSIPVIRMAKPTRIAPRSRFLPFFMNMIKTTPITARIGENEVGLTS